MSQFLSPIKAIDIDEEILIKNKIADKSLADGYHRQLLEDVIYHVGSPSSTDKIVVPKGFIWDGGSVPRIFWNIVDPWGSASKAYLLHDWLYAIQERSRLVSDAILMEAMEVLGVPLWKRKLIYRGVRIGGWYAWKKNKNKKLINLEL